MSVKVHKIFISSRMYIEQSIDNKEKIVDEDVSWGLISIYSRMKLISTPQRIENLKKLQCVDYLSLDFSDIEKPIEGEVLFDDTHAKDLLKFIDKIKDKIEVLVVHCQAGISRSGAVGLFLCKYLGLNESIFWLHNPNIMPNKHVLAVLGNLTGIDTTGYRRNDSSYQRRYGRFKRFFNGNLF